MDPDPPINGSNNSNHQEPGRSEKYPIDMTTDFDAGVNQDGTVEFGMREFYVQQLPTEKYKFEKQLGEGGMGTVSAVQDTYISRTVAVKELKKNFPSHDRDALINEARVLGQFEHPNLPTIFSLEIDEEGLPFYTMQNEGNRSLKDLILEMQQVSDLSASSENLSNKLDIIQGILHGLNYAHHLSFLHRDIKPANIMIGDCGEVKLIDWGLANRNEKSGDGSDSEESARTSFSGTPRYSAPEQARGDVGAVDQRSDLYSAFVCFFELLTLAPFHDLGLSIQETLEVVSKKSAPSVDDPRFSNHLVVAVPKELRYFLAKGLENDPAKRFQTAAEAVGYLKKLRGGKVELLCVVTLIKKALRVIEHSLDQFPRTVSTLLVLAIVSGCVFATSGLWSLMRP